MPELKYECQSSGDENWYPLTTVQFGGLLGGLDNGAIKEVIIKYPEGTETIYRKRISLSDKEKLEKIAKVVENPSDLCGPVRQIRKILA